MRRSRPIAVGIAFSLLSAACSESGPPRDDAGAIIGTREISAQHLQDGDCYDLPAESFDPDGAGIITVLAVPCSGPHEFKVFSSFDLTEGAFPGIQAVDDQAALGCLASFAESMGVELFQSDRYFEWLAPTEEAWRFRDRTVHCILPTVDLPVRDADGAVIEAGEAAFPREGDCFDATRDEGVEARGTTWVVPCSGPHDFEIFSSFDLTEGDFPGSGEVDEDAYQGCLTLFEGFVGVPYTESDLEFLWFAPVAESWMLGDRTVLCILPSLDVPVRDTDGTAITAGFISVSKLRAGDCFDDPDPSLIWLETVRVVPCAQPHDNEVYLAFEMSDGPYPGPRAVTEQADERCFGAFEEFVGSEYLQSELEFFSYPPSAESWAFGDRAVYCVLYAVDLSKLEGSMGGSGG